MTVAVIFSSTLSTDHGGYDEMSERMVALAREQAGFLGIESVREPDGRGITVSYWADDEAARAWKRVAEHLRAQRLGRERWYSDYRVVVAEVVREYGSQ